MDTTAPTSPGPATSQAGEATPLVAKNSRLLSYDELEDWRKDNHYILTGYRQTLKSYYDCFASIFGVHNETTNIASSFLYLVMAITSHERSRDRQGWRAPLAGIPYPFPSAAQPSVTWIDSFGKSDLDDQLNPREGFGVFFVSAATCLGFSASFHALCCHSKEVAHRWNNFDYVGIVVLISGTFVPAVRYGFFCDPHLRNLYITLIYSAALFTAYTVLAPHAKTPEFRRFRAWIFIALGTSAVFPVGHAVLRYGLEGASDGIALPWLALGGALYIVGAVLYAERCPERFLPGRFDLFGSSHQIFHALILLAALSHWAAISEGFRYWHGERGGVCPVR